MANEIGEGVAPEIDTNDIVVEENDDVDALKEKFEKVSEQNRQLFSRAKKAEGFELKDGKWVKPEVKPKAEPKENKGEHEPEKKPSQSDKLDYGQIALLRQEGIKGTEEVALFEEIMSETGKGVLETLDSKYFQSRMADFREAKESQNAIPKGKNRSGQQGTSDIDVAVEKFKETGKMPEDFKTRIAIKNALLAEETNKNKFSGQSVIGPQEQSY